MFTEQFYGPAVEILGPCMNWFIFEQEHHVRNDRVPISELAKDPDGFFTQVPGDKRYDLELRTEVYLADPVLDVLKRHGVGLDFSH